MEKGKRPAGIQKPGKPEKPAKDPNRPKGFTQLLKGVNDDRLRFIVKPKADGTWLSRVTLISPKNEEGKRTRSHGATTVHASLEVAKAAVEKLVAQAVSQGWLLRAKRASRKDSFDASSLPSPIK